MIAYYIKDILSIAPEAIEFIKQANIEEDFPSDSKDSVAASYLSMNYLNKVAHKPVDIEQFKRIEKAAELYKLPEVLSGIVQKFEQFDIEKKAASQRIPEHEELKMLESYFVGNLTGFVDIEKQAQAAEHLYDTYKEKITSPEVIVYSGNGYLHKEAAIGALIARQQATGDRRFLKVATIIRNTEPLEYSMDDLRKLAHIVTKLDKEYHLGTVGFNFYKESMTKEASGICIKLMNQQVPYEKFVKFGNERIGTVLGSDVSKALNGDVGNDKAVIESLPMDMQKVLHSFVKNC